MAWKRFNNQGIWDDRNQLVIPNGLYVISSQPNTNKWWAHSAILDVGNKTKLAPSRCYDNDNNAYNPFVIHMSRGGIERPLIGDYLDAKPNTKIIASISNVEAAKANMIDFEEKHGNNYSSFFNNCEHFVSYAVKGEKESPTVQNATAGAFFAGVVGIQVLPVAISLGKWLFGGNQRRA